jgi:hypothetical protein
LEEARILIHGPIKERAGLKSEGAKSCGFCKTDVGLLKSVQSLPKWTSTTEGNCFHFPLNSQRTNVKDQRLSSAIQKSLNLKSLRYERPMIAVLEIPQNGQYFMEIGLFSAISLRFQTWSYCELGFSKSFGSGLCERRAIG